jgi:hypothetical protein
MSVFVLFSDILFGLKELYNLNKSKLLIHLQQQSNLLKSIEKTILLCRKFVHYLKRV